MNQRRIILFVPGILTMPGDARDWNIEAIRWVNTHIPEQYRADDFEYFTTALTRPLRDADRANRFAVLLMAYSKAGYDITIAAHSNGCDVVLDALKRAAWPRLTALHLISAACESDFEKNGLNMAMLRERIGTVTVYIGAKDWALRLARTWFGKFLGYGTLGLTGPTKNSPVLEDRISVEHESSFGHSTWFQPAQFDRTMKLLTL